jgi:peptidoglycan/LPS O-acetylase OafA/YrhL
MGKILFWVGVTVFILSLLLYMFTNPYGYGLSFPRMPYVFPVMPIAVVLILVFGRHSPSASRISSFPVFGFLANISYSLYLWHDFFMTLAFSYLGFPKTGHLGLWAFEIAIIFAVSFLIAWASWHFFESRLVNWSHAVTKKQTTGNI